MKNIKAFTAKSSNYNLLLLMGKDNNKYLTFGRWSGTKYCGSVSKQWNLSGFSEIKNYDKILIKDVNVFYSTFAELYQYLKYLINHHGLDVSGNSFSPICEPFISLMDGYLYQNKTITSKDTVMLLTDYKMITLVLNDGSFIENNTELSSDVIKDFTFKNFTFKKQDLKISLI